MDRMVIGSGRARAEIDPCGAELKSWSVGGRELIWPGDTESWPRSAPILFPVVGRCAGGEIRVDGRSYPMPVHGFAPTSRFTGERIGGGAAAFTLTDTAESRRHYPFAFRLQVGFALSGPTLAVRLTVKNRGETPMPYAAGLHPGFLWQDRINGGDEQATVEFSETESAEVPEITAEGYFASDRRSLSMHGRRMALSAANLGGEAVCFLDARSAELTFRQGDGSALRVRNEGFSHVALWTSGKAPFLSIESWTGHGDTPGYGGEFAARPSMISLPPGEQIRHGATYHFEEAACA
ncbi:aldose 1-epimerase family protein [Pseudohoeflea coraliihabitans]|uniref:Aldose 1-epimerase family protein n=1 Tax=Pseudohoeflea coraliihabitans TaxID=2860393 RepID=A0ABS6WNI3_9HYPH|nr:aldose 1-epimerase family protein [Pseudohoeflea sp. DP4N28-3]MBW3096629.1 aldose 1-epimerase family protein [Pseudohoeflea sp. DP4N28-3]